MFKKVVSLVISLACVMAVLSLFAVPSQVFAEEASSWPENEQAEGTEAGTAHTNGHVVCLDPGHQSYEIDMSEPEPVGPGAVETKARCTSGTSGSYTGIPEYALNLDVALKLRDILKNRGYTVIMTRTNNETAISNSERALMAGNEGAEIFVRIHANGDETHQNSGAMALCPSAANPYVASLSAESDRLSSCILNAYCNATGFGNLGIQYNDGMTGINWSTVPVTILEMGFMTNEYDDNRMADVEFQQIMAVGIADGIDSFFGIDTSAAEETEEGMMQNSGQAEPSETLSDTGLSDTGSETLSETGLSGTASGTAYPGTTPDSDPFTGSLDTGNEIHPVNPIPQPDEAMRGLLSQILSGLPQNNGQWAVYVGNLSSGAGTGINSKRMQAASLIKLYIMGAVYERYDELSGIYGAETLDSLLHAMITVSDNDAANTLTAYLGNGDADAGMQAVTEYCTTHGYKDSHMGRLLLHPNDVDDNYTSVEDCAYFLWNVYCNANGMVPETNLQEEVNDPFAQASDGTQVPASGTASAQPLEAVSVKAKPEASYMPGAGEMLSLLSQQTRRNKIPSKLPMGVSVANKTGELGDVENDAGIIYNTASGDVLVVCFMSEYLTSVGEAQSVIGDLSLLIYNYYNA